MISVAVVGACGYIIIMVDDAQVAVADVFGMPIVGQVLSITVVVVIGILMVVVVVVVAVIVAVVVAVVVVVIVVVVRAAMCGSG